MTIYPAILHKDESSDWGISFPDFPGCVSAGSTLDEVMRMGAEALHFHIDTMTNASEAIPLPCAVQDAEMEAQSTAGSVVMISIPGRMSL